MGKIPEIEVGDEVILKVLDIYRVRAYVESVECQADTPPRSPTVTEDGTITDPGCLGEYGDIHVVLRVLSRSMATEEPT